jgi:hypothetical protein
MSLLNAELPPISRVGRACVRSVFFALSVLFLLPASGEASPITFTHQGSGSGTLNGVAFEPSSFVITATGDTSTVADLGLVYLAEHTSASISITGVGSVDFVTPTATFVN